MSTGWGRRVGDEDLCLVAEHSVRGDDPGGTPAVVIHAVMIHAVVTTMFKRVTNVLNVPYRHYEL